MFYASHSYVMNEFRFIRFLIMKSVKLLSMIFLLLCFCKVGFCEMFAKQGTLQRSGREVLRDEMFKN